MFLQNLSRIWERWVVMPYAAFILLTAEYSRYLTQTEWTKIVLAPRTLLILGLGLTLVWLALKKATKQEVFTLSDLWWLGVPVALALWSMLALRWSAVALGADPAGYLTNFWLYGIFLVLIIALLGRDKKYLRILITTAMLGAIGVIAIGLWEKTTDTHLVLSNLNNPYRQQWAVTSVFIGQNHLAASLAVFLPVMAGWAFTFKRFWKYLTLLTVLGGVAVLFFTGSTLGLIALLTSGVVFITVAILRRTSGSRIKKLVRVVAGTLGVVVVASVIWIALPSDIKVRFSLAAVGVQQSIAERIALVTTAWSLMRENFWRGVGPDGAETALRSLSLVNIKNLHSLVLEIGVTFGVPALMLFLLWLVTLLIWSFQQVLRASKKNMNVWLAGGILASLSSFIFWQAAPSTFEGVRAPFILLGVAIVLGVNRQKAVVNFLAASSLRLKDLKESISVVIPAYNEAKRIPQTLKDIYSFLEENSQNFEIIVVDDGSSDDTVVVVRTLTKRMRELSVVSYTPNRGKGFAVRQGLVRAKGDWIVYMDADHSTNISELLKLPTLIKMGGDVFVSSRYLPGSRVVVKQPPMRILVSRLANALIRTILPGIYDTQNGFKIIKKSIVANFSPTLVIDRWLFDVEILYAARRAKCMIIEFPVVWRNSADSKLSIWKDLSRTSRDAGALLRGVIFGRYRKKSIKNV